MRSQSIPFIGAGLAPVARVAAVAAAMVFAGLVPAPGVAQAAEPAWQVTTTGLTPPDVLGPAGEGRRMFLALNCYSCHGNTATGGMGPNIVGRDRATVASAVMFGRAGGMRSFAEYVSQTDITNITAYLNSIGTPDEPTFSDWWKLFPKK